MSNCKYFGTDGSRRRVGDAPTTPHFVLPLGWSAGSVLPRHAARYVLTGHDNRISG
ncbi:phosphoglucosamine mutase, partial [Cronobacter sakazakii]